MSRIARIAARQHGVVPRSNSRRAGFGRIRDHRTHATRATSSNPPRRLRRGTQGSELARALDGGCSRLWRRRCLESRLRRRTLGPPATDSMAPPTSRPHPPRPNHAPRNPRPPLPLPYSAVVLALLPAAEGGRGRRPRPHHPPRQHPRHHGPAHHRRPRALVPPRVPRPPRNPPSRVQGPAPRRHRDRPHPQRPGERLPRPLRPPSASTRPRSTPSSAATKSTSSGVSRSSSSKPTPSSTTEARSPSRATTRATSTAPAGYAVLRFTDKQLEAEPERIVADIRKELAAARR